MIHVQHPRLAAAVVSLGVGLLLLGITPEVAQLERIDRKLFGLLSGKGDAVLGRGSVEEPRRTEDIRVPEQVPPAGVLFLDEDPDEYFEAMPPVPTDMAVVFSRLKGLGAETVAIAPPLHWDEPDTLAVEAMRATMDRLDGSLLGFQMINATSSEPVAVPFQLCSIPYSEVRGDRSKLPVVNALPGNLPELGGRKTRAGFTVLGSEIQEEGRAYLLARWDDRVVFALPLATEIVRRGVPLDQVTIEAGNEIRLGSDGPRIPIDFRGRVDLPKQQPEVLIAPATAMISRELPQGFGENGAPVYLVDSRLEVGKFEREWNELLARIDGVIRQASRRVGMQEVPRPMVLMELCGLVAVALAGSWLLKGRDVVRRLAIALASCGAVALVLLLVIRGLSLAPMPLAFLSVPATALLMVLLTEGGGRIEVVRAKPSSPASEATPKPGRKKKRHKR